MKRALTTVAVGLIVLGMIAMAGPTFGFSSAAADREVQVATSDDPNAYLGIIDNTVSNDIKVNKGNSGSVYDLNDNAGTLSSANDISANVIAFSGDTGDIGFEASVKDDSGQNDYEVIVTCGSSNRKATETVTIELITDRNPRIELGRTTADTISVNCKNNGGGNNGVGNGGGNNGVGNGGGNNGVGNGGGNNGVGNGGGNNGVGNGA
ncbi:hypothetical protein [Natrinema hispanicum]|uniref:hypothetical protein n=1 Tax=Natrinema hispanicum TaxID=392421 RepID=UPI000B882403|nr:hypothetical protein [Natrinema hispanicum]